jgi:hypothetical protein
MADQVDNSVTPWDVPRLRKGEMVLEILTGIAIALGLALLWLLERVRDGFFYLLDQVNLKPWTRRGTAFPPGRPRKLKQAKSAN